MYGRPKLEQNGFDATNRLENKNAKIKVTHNEN